MSCDNNKQMPNMKNHMSACWPASAREFFTTASWGERGRLSFLATGSEGSPEYFIDIHLAIKLWLNSRQGKYSDWINAQTPLLLNAELLTLFPKDCLSYLPCYPLRAPFTCVPRVAALGRSAVVGFKGKASWWILYTCQTLRRWKTVIKCSY